MGERERVWVSGREQWMSGREGKLEERRGKKVVCSQETEGDCRWEKEEKVAHVWEGRGRRKTTADGWERKECVFLCRWIER